MPLYNTLNFLLKNVNTKGKKSVMPVKKKRRRRQNCFDADADKLFFLTSFSFRSTRMAPARSIIASPDGVLFSFSFDVRLERVSGLLAGVQAQGRTGARLLVSEAEAGEIT